MSKSTIKTSHNGLILVMASFGILVALFLLSCNHPVKKNGADEFRNVPSSVAKRIDSLDVLIKKYYASDPDSAELLAYSAIGTLDSFHCPQKKISLYMFLSEFYQYRKSDKLKAIQSSTKAMGIFIENPGTTLTNDPYLFVDIGNVLFSYNFYTEANTFYRIAFEQASKIKNTHAQALSMQNIALSFSGQQKYDSALYYLWVADRSIPDRTDIMHAQNCSYISADYLSLNQQDSLLEYAQRSLAILDYYKSNRQEMAQNLHDKIYIEWNSISLNVHKVLFNFYGLSAQSDSSLRHYRLAMEHAKKIGLGEAGAELYLKRALLARRLSEIDKAASYADSAMNLAQRFSDPEIIKTWSDSLSVFFGQNQVLDLQAKYDKLSRQLSDTLYRQNSSRELIRHQMALSSIAAEYVAMNLKADQDIKTGTIRFQQRYILVITLFVLIVLVAFYLFMRQKRKLEKTYKNLVDQIQQSLQLEDEQAHQKLLSGNTPGLAENLEFLMRTRKPFLQKKLNLNDVAAMLHTNQTYLSNLLNSQYKQKFNDYINLLRVKEVCRLMRNPANQKLSLDQLADLAGFNTRSTFYHAFKQFTGISPAAFLETQCTLLRETEQHDSFADISS
jgi:AraC-like DNA-binding protein